jgi:hypothetical protein
MPVHDWSRVNAGLFHHFHYVPAPLDATYQTTWSVCPAPLKDLVLGSGTEAAD